MSPFVVSMPMRITEPAMTMSALASYVTYPVGFHIPRIVLQSRQIAACTCLGCSETAT
jgi:hypothetical protein